MLLFGIPSVTPASTPAPARVTNQSTVAASAVGLSAIRLVIKDSGLRLVPVRERENGQGVTETYRGAGGMATVTAARGTTVDLRISRGMTRIKTVPPTHVSLARRSDGTYWSTRVRACLALLGGCVHAALRLHSDGRFANGQGDVVGTVACSVNSRRGVRYVSARSVWPEAHRDHNAEGLPFRVVHGSGSYGLFYRFSPLTVRLTPVRVPQHYTAVPIGTGDLASAVDYGAILSADDPTSTDTLTGALRVATLEEVWTGRRAPVVDGMEVAAATS